VDLDISVHGVQTLANAGESEAFRRRRRPKAGAIVSNPEAKTIRGRVQPHGRVSGLTVLDDVLQRLFRHAEETERNIGRKMIGYALHFALNVDLRFFA
jgi:hypothetical protein